MLTWEFPPKRLGEISDHVSTLAHELLKRNHEVEVVVLDDWRQGFEDVYGVHIHRVANSVKTHPMASVLSYAVTASVAIETESSNVIYYFRQSNRPIDLVHAHEWFTIYPAISIKHAFDVPFVLTLHSTEGHRCHDRFGPVSIGIREIEDMGVWESARVITNTEWLKNEVLRYYGQGHREKIDVVWPIGQDWIKETLSVYRKIAGQVE